MDQQLDNQKKSTGKNKYLIGGILIFAAIIYLIVSSTQANAQYFMTVEELSQNDNMVGKSVRVSGVVLGDTIQYDLDTLELNFTVAHVPGDHQLIEEMGGMAAVLRAAAIDSSLARIQVIYYGEKPDLLKDESQAIMTGSMGEDGYFHAEELLLKCPTKYEEAVPEQAEE